MLRAFTETNPAVVWTNTRQTTRQPVMSNPDLLERAMRMVQRRDTAPLAANSFVASAAEHARQILEPAQQNSNEVEMPPALPSEQDNFGLARVTPTKERKAAGELVAMILGDLSKVEGCPRHGVKVVVYGSNPWNSWLSFGADAGPVRNKADLQRVCDIITARLKRLYDIN